MTHWPILGPQKAYECRVFHTVVWTNMPTRHVSSLEGEGCRYFSWIYILKIKLSWSWYPSTFLGVCKYNWCKNKGNWLKVYAFTLNPLPLLDGDFHDSRICFFLVKFLNESLPRPHKRCYVPAYIGEIKGESHYQFKVQFPNYYIYALHTYRLNRSIWCPLRYYTVPVNCLKMNKSVFDLQLTDISNVLTPSWL